MKKLILLIMLVLPLGSLAQSIVEDADGKSSIMFPGGNMGINSSKESINLSYLSLKTAGYESSFDTIRGPGETIALAVQVKTPTNSFVQYELIQSDRITLVKRTFIISGIQVNSSDTIVTFVSAADIQPLTAIVNDEIYLDFSDLDQVANTFQQILQNTVASNEDLGMETSSYLLSDFLTTSDNHRISQEDLKRGGVSLAYEKHVRNPIDNTLIDEYSTKNYKVTNFQHATDQKQVYRASQSVERIGVRKKNSLFWGFDLTANNADGTASVFNSDRLTLGTKANAILGFRLKETDSGKPIKDYKYLFLRGGISTVGFERFTDDPLPLDQSMISEITINERTTDFNLALHFSKWRGVAKDFQKGATWPKAMFGFSVGLESSNNLASLGKTSIKIQRSNTITNTDNTTSVTSTITEKEAFTGEFKSDMISVPMKMDWVFMRKLDPALNIMINPYLRADFGEDLSLFRLGIGVYPVKNQGGKVLGGIIIEQFDLTNDQADIGSFIKRFKIALTVKFSLFDNPFTKKP